MSNYKKLRLLLPQLCMLLLLYQVINVFGLHEPYKAILSSNSYLPDFEEKNFYINIIAYRVQQIINKTSFGLYIHAKTFL